MVTTTLSPAARAERKAVKRQLQEAERARNKKPLALPAGLTGTTTPAGIAANDPDADADEYFNRQRATEFSRETDGAPAPGSRLLAPDCGEIPPDTGQVVQVGLDLVHVHPKNRRPETAAVKALAESFQDPDAKQLQPILVRVPPKGSAYPLPEGHVQIVFGERRYQAAKKAGWESIEARIRTDLDDAATLALMAEENAKRQDLNPIERARLIETLCEPIAKGGAGLTREAAAKRVGLASGSAASNLVRLLELPKAWQDRVAGGELPESFARLLLPYVPAPKLLDQLDHDYQKSRKSRNDWDRERWEKRDTLERHLEKLIQENTRPIDGKAEIRYDYDQIGTYAQHGRLFELTDEVRKSLDVVTIPVRGKPLEVATDIKAFDKLQLPLVKAKHKGDIARKESRRITGRPKAKDKAAKPAKLTPAQLAKRRQEEDRQLALSVEQWRHNWIMERVYHELSADLEAMSVVDQATRWRAGLALVTFIAAGGVEDWCGDGAERAIEETLAVYRFTAAKRAKGDKRQRQTCRLELWSLLAQAAGNEEAVVNAAVAVCRALLLSPEPLKVDNWYSGPTLATAIVEDLARLVGIDVAAEWHRLQDRTKASAAKLTTFFELFTADQLDTLGQELGVFAQFANGKTAKIKLMTSYAEPGGTKRLPLPKSIKPLAIAAGKERRPSKPKVSKRAKGAKS